MTRVSPASFVPLAFVSLVALASCVLVVDAPKDFAEHCQFAGRDTECGKCVRDYSCALQNFFGRKGTQHIPHQMKR